MIHILTGFYIKNISTNNDGTSYVKIPLIMDDISDDDMKDNETTA